MYGAPHSTDVDRKPMQNVRAGEVGGANALKPTDHPLTHHFHPETLISVQILLLRPSFRVPIRLFGAIF